MNRHGLVILVSLVVVTTAALAAGTIAMLARADGSQSNAVTARTQARALAWSGAQVLANELYAQRDDLLGGATPTLPESWTLWTDEFGRTGVVRVMTDDAGVSTKAEPARLHLNAGTDDMLAALSGVGEQNAAKIIEARPIAYIEQVLMLSKQSQKQGSNSDLLPLMTVLSADPELAAGAGSVLVVGEPRFDLTQGWPDELAALFTDPVNEIIRGEIESGSLKSRAGFVDLLVASGIEPRRWGEVFDAVRFGEDDSAEGRVDLSVAPSEVLASLPGVDAEGARRIVDARSRLGDQRLRSIAWAVVEGIISTDQFKQCAAWLTTRSVQWRITIETGFTATSETDTLPLEDRVVLELVIDVSGGHAQIRRMIDTTLSSVTVPDRVVVEPDGKEAPSENDRDMRTSMRSAQSNGQVSPGTQATRVGRMSVWGGGS